MGKQLTGLIFLAILALLLVGCGGFGGEGPGFAAGIIPDSFTVQVGNTQDLEAVSTRSIQGVVWVVREGAGGGSLSTSSSNGQFVATYTAPGTPGTYHIDATITFAGGGSSQVTAVATVQ
jgi:hypothetical protein